ncbi:CHAT domain-containing protein [Oxynema aestuarii]|uniref:CHAT domain-containing protein n=1 Tax=Oxynema aestuarii AP17 TaxID=2064643 RepID=A0A6H1TWU6_9CYAN|nr:CHAT domain-containing protein [Oxynema aestuarii]QIZ71072.1 CHAT domain-containing protein [Oxynema aestuarii AP17]
MLLTVFGRLALGCQCWLVRRSLAIETVKLPIGRIVLWGFLLVVSWAIVAIPAGSGDRPQPFSCVGTEVTTIAPEATLPWDDSSSYLYRKLLDRLLPAGDREGELYRLDTQEAAKILRAIAAIHGVENPNSEETTCDRLSARRRKSLEQIDPEAVTLYPIVLADRLEVVVGFPDGQFGHYTIAVCARELSDLATQMRQSLRRTSFANERLPLAQQFYRWLVEPIATELDRYTIATLVFVLDGPLWNLPIAALHDGTGYLVEKYAIALAPLLRVVEPRSQPLEDFEALVGGLSQSRAGFAPLPGVERELHAIAALRPTRLLLDERFTREQLVSSLQERPFEIVHLATHGQFSSDPQQTFILTWDGPVNLNEFERLLRSGTARSIELLVLSACQTAQGDKRAALGLAGIAVRSGARSTLASLWPVQDASSAQLMMSFYHELMRSGVGKAQALRRAQLSLLQQPQYKHPFYWAAFVLVGLWI